MRRTLASAIALSIAAAIPLAAQNGEHRAAMLVSPQALAAQLHDTNLVLLHVGDRAEYDAEHLPGARFASLIDIAAPMSHDNGAPAPTLDVPAPDVLRASLEKLGISDRSRVVIYWGKDRLTHATRIWFTLDQAGLGTNASVLDGGMPAWKLAGLPTTADAPAARTGKLSPLTYRKNVVTGEWVRDNVGRAGTFVVDARTPNFYSGESEGGPRDARRRGHIPGAASLPFISIADSATNVLRSADALATLFAAAGAKPGDTIVTYCHIGQQATAVFFAARSLGYDVKLYDGSFEDWARRGWPVEAKATGSP